MIIHNPQHMRQTLTILLFIFAALGSQAQQAIGQWRDHFPNTGTIAVAHGNDRVYAANPYMVFEVNLVDNSIEKYSKAKRLSDIGISDIAFDQVTGTLVIGYENGNIDLLREGSTTNVRSIQNSGIFGVKSINHILIESGRCYLSCGFGIVYYDLVKQEVIDTYIIGPGGANLQVYGTAKWNGKIYAATDIGLMQADANNAFLSSFTNWSLNTSVPNPNHAVYAIASTGERLVVGQRFENEDDVAMGTADGNTWDTFWSHNTLRSLSFSGGRLVLCGENYVDTYFPNLSWNYVVNLSETGTFIESRDAVIFNPTEIWLGDETRGLIQFNHQNETFSTYQPVGPKHIDVYRLRFTNGLLFKTSGSPAPNWSRTFNPRGVEIFNREKWTTYDSENSPIFQTDNLYDFMSVAVDPQNENHWFIGTWGRGLLELKDGAFIQRYDEENSPLQGAGETGGPGIGGLQFDDNGTLWMSNGYSNTPVVALDNEGEWHAFSANAAGATGSELFADFIIDQAGYKWFVRPRGHGLVVYNDNNTLDDATDDQAISINNDVGQGDLPTVDVYSVAEDLNGEIWVGTAEGIAVFYSAGSVFSGNNFDAQQILLEQDGNIQILLETELVHDIAVDGANQKWIATESSGVFLMSPDGTTEIKRFNKNNSPLPSNFVRSIAIDGETGEVFFGTNAGVISYKGTATDGRLENLCAKVYPNPVRENYTGPIAIDGLERNTNVKITDVAGNLVYETTSEGGQAIWYGNRFNGERVTTGVYTALCTAPEGNSKCVAKIMVVR